MFVPGTVAVRRTVVETETTTTSDGKTTVKTKKTTEEFYNKEAHVHGTGNKTAATQKVQALE